MKALNAFMKPFEELQRSMKIKILLICFSMQLSEMQGTRKDNKKSLIRKFHSETLDTELRQYDC